MKASAQPMILDVALEFPFNKSSSGGAASAKNTNETRSQEI